MRPSHLALGALTLAFLAAAVFEPRKPGVVAPAAHASAPAPALPPSHFAAVTPPVPERPQPSAAGSADGERHEIVSRIESSGAAQTWSAPARRMVGEWLAASSDHLLSSRVDCHREACIAHLRYRDREALKAVTAALEQKIEDWPGPKMQMPAHDVDGALGNEWIFLPPDEMRRQ